MDTQKFSINDSEVKFFATIFLLLVVLLALSLFFGTRVERGGVSVPGETATRVFQDVVIGAKAAYVYDVRTREVLYAENEDMRLALASLTKIMTALVASDIASDDSEVVITTESLMATGDSGLRGGERWTLKNLLDFSLISSSNDGMQAVALALGAHDQLRGEGTAPLDNFVLRMNEQAWNLDLKNTYFYNTTGLDETTDKGGAYGTAKDVVKLVEHILMYKPELLEATRVREATFISNSNIKHEIKNTNKMLDGIPGLLASKTGYTDIGGGNLVVAFDPELGRPIVISVLGSTEEGRFEDMQKLIDATLEYITGESTTY